MIAIINYGAGNIGNILRALKFIGKEALVVEKTFDLSHKVEIILLPGVGSFAPASKKLRKTGWLDFLKDWGEKEKPILGICLGMQLLCESSTEGNYSEGLRIFEGTIKKLVNVPKLPHIGWNEVKWTSNFISPWGESSQKAYFYFVHSYALEVTNNTTGITTYGESSFSAIIQKPNAIGFQFHPERSGGKGLSLLRWAIEKLEE